MYCNKCGEDNADGEKLCTKCGAELLEENLSLEKDIDQEVKSDEQGITEDVTVDTTEEVKEDATVDEWFAGVDEDEEEDSETSLESNEVKKKSAFRSYINNNGRVIVISLCIVFAVLLAIFYKPVFYSAFFTTAKIVANVDENSAIGIAKTAYAIDNKAECEAFINNACATLAKQTLFTDPDKAIEALNKSILDANDKTNAELLITAYCNKANKLLNTDINAAIKVAQDGLAATKSSELQIVIDNANALNEYAKTYGSAFIGSIDGRKISISEYKVFLNDVKNQIEKSAKVAATDLAKKNFWAGEIQGKKAAVFAKDQAMTNVRQFTIQLINAENNNTVIDKTQMNSTLIQISDYQKSLGTTDEVAKAAFLKQFGVSLSQFQSVYKDVMLVGKYEQDEVSKVKATDAELKTYYDKNKDTFDSLAVIHVLLLTSNPNTGVALSASLQAAAKKKADNVYALAKAGGDMTALAKKYSEDPGLADNKGEYTFKKGEMVAEFETWAFKAKIGDIGLVKSSYGYHVMKLLKRTGYADVTKTDLNTAYGNAQLKIKVDAWEKDPKYAIIKDQKIIDAIKII